jgi:hypothetical protein
MKLIIAGSRNFMPTNWMVEDAVKQYKATLRDSFVSEVVSGCAAGADRGGERWARWKDIPVKPFPADWRKHGQLAGKIRNREMGDYADGLIDFWDTDSPGSAHMIAYMHFIGKPALVVDWRKLKGLC